MFVFNSENGNQILKCSQIILYNNPIRLSFKLSAEGKFLSRIKIVLFVVALPDVTVHDINTDLEFVVVACDGIWDVLSNVEVVEFCRQRIANQMEPTKVLFA